MVIPQRVLILYSALTEITSTAAILWLLWIGLKKAELPPPVKARTWWSVSVVVALWYLSFSILGQHRFFQASRDIKLPHIPFGVFVPLLVGWWAALRIEPIRKAVEAVPMSWLIGVQFYRVVGLIFVVLAICEQLPPEFGYPAGVGDIIVGILAVPVAYLIARGAKSAIAAAYIWNVLGILDFVIAIATGFLSSPSRIQRLALSHPNVIGSAYPLVMIPVFLVPLSWILHLLCIWKLNRRQLTPRMQRPYPSKTSTSDAYDFVQ